MVPIILANSFASLTKINDAFLSKNPASIPIYSWVTNSPSEPLAYYKNLIFSFVVSLSSPSAIFDGTDKPERVI
jgi:hypothetical protein